MSYTSVFGGSVVRPSQPSYSALTISANTALVWPLETTEGVPSVAGAMDITATIGALQLQMPPGNTGSTGVVSMITNVGASTFTVTDQAGNAIATLLSTQAWLIILTSNETANGTWRAVQMGATTSTATAAALAGLGLQAFGSLLQSFEGKRYTTVNTTLVASDRSSVVVWQGSGGGTMQLDTIANLTPGWSCSVMNEDAADASIIIVGSGGQTINGEPNLGLSAGSAATLVCSSGGFDTSAVSESNVLQFNGLTMQYFTANGTYTPNPNMTFVICLLVGAGGGGAGFWFSQSIAGGGGGAGEFAMGVFAAAAVGASQTITIGVGGAGGPNGGEISDGGTGGNTSFGSLLQALGAPGGINDQGGYGASGGSGTGFHAPGGDGFDATYGANEGQTTYTNGGTGAASFFGSGGLGGQSSGINGRSGQAPGSGGGGAGATGTPDNTGSVAGAGASGALIVLEFA